MKKLFASFLVIAFSAVSAGAAVPESFAPLVEKLSPAVVNISSSQKIHRGGAGASPFGNVPPGQEEQLKEFFERFGMPLGQPLEQEVQSLGSGFVIDPEGYIVTNNHVVEQAEQITVRFADNSKYEAKLVGRDPKTDLALLKIDSKKDFPYVTFGDSDKTRVGDWVVTIGNPYGLGGTVTAGIISARSRNINAGPFDDFLQTDAAINQGNSGGPMFNADGEVIGVNTAIFSPTGGSVGIGFAVPSALAKPVLQQLKEHGRTHRGWLGVKIQQVTDEIANSLGLKKDKGALVLEVTPDSPADKAGVKAGDIILSFDGKDIPEMHILPRVVAETKVGREVNVVVWRDGDEEELEVTLGELDEGEELAAAKTPDKKDTKPVPTGEPLLGVEVEDLTAALRSRFNVPKDVEGIVIVRTKPDSEAAKRGVEVGDVILAVNQQEVDNVSDAQSELKKAKSDGRDYVLVRIWRGGESTYITLPTK